STGSSTKQTCGSSRCPAAVGSIICPFVRPLPSSSTDCLACDDAVVTAWGIRRCPPRARAGSRRLLWNPDSLKTRDCEGSPLQVTSPRPSSCLDRPCAVVTRQSGPPPSSPVTRCTRPYDEG